MTQETGPIYCIPLIEFLPMGETMRQAMPSRDDLEDCIASDHERVAEGYEVLLSHYHRACEERDRLRSLLREINEWDRDYPSLPLGIVERIEKEIAP